MKYNYKLKLMVLYTLVLTGYYRFVILFIPFKKLALRMGTLGRENLIEPDEKMLPYIKSVRKTVMLVSKNTPWESLCFVQALTAQKLLQRKHISNTVYLGLAKDDDNKPIAHAWIKSGEKIVVGEKGAHKFSVIAKFGSV